MISGGYGERVILVVIKHGNIGGFLGGYFFYDT